MNENEPVTPAPQPGWYFHGRNECPMWFDGEAFCYPSGARVEWANTFNIRGPLVPASEAKVTTPAPAGEVQSKSMLKRQAVQRGEEIPSGYVTIERHEAELAALKAENERLKTHRDRLQGELDATRSGNCCKFHQDLHSENNALRQQVAELTRERDEARKAILSFGDNPAGFDWAVLGRIDELETQLTAAREAIREVRGSGIAYTNEGRYHEVQIGVELWERLSNLTEHHADDDELVDEKFANSLGLKQKSDSGYCWVLGVGGVGRTVVLSNPRGVICDDVWYLSLGGVNLNIVVTRRDVRRLAAALGVTLKESAEGDL